MTSKKKIKNLEIYFEDIGEGGNPEDIYIAMLQREENPETSDCIYLSADMVDDVCEKLQDLKKAMVDEES